MLSRLILGFLAVLFIGSPAWGQLQGSDTTAGSSCASYPEGTSRFTASPSGDGSSVVLICDGSVWQKAGGADLPELASSRIWVGNASNAATAVAMSGDATLSNAGILTIGSNAIGSAEITDGSIANADLAGAIALSKLSITGTGSASNFLRGDGSWQTVPAGADNLGNHTASQSIISDTTNTDDLGTTAIRWKDGWFAGTVTAGTFAGSGASLTALPAANLTGTLPAISGANLTSLNATNLASGTVAAARLPALTGDVTSPAGSAATTIANNAVTAAKTSFVGTLTEGKWCTVSSGKIVCTSDAPGGGGLAGWERVSKAQTATSISVSCSSGKKVLGGGCSTTYSTVTASNPASDTSWSCGFEGNYSGNKAYAICASIP